MIIELSNGLDHLFQWDTGQKVKVPENVPTVHFKWGSDAVSFDVVDGWVEIAPELTQKAGDILLWTYKEDHTLDAARIPVKRRPKPDGYAYTPTEIKTWEQLDERIKALEAANVQANWDQNDASAADYVRGRTHYVGAKHDVRIIKQTSGKFSPELGLIVGNTYQVDYDRGTGFGVGKEFVCKDLNEGKDGIEPAPYVGDADRSGGPNPYLIFNNSIELLPAFDHMVNIKGWKIEGDFADIKTLDTKYLDPKLLERIKALEDGAPSAGDPSLGVTGATVGQTVKISAVDTNGVPTAWEPVDMASGGYELIFTDTVSEDSAGYFKDKDTEGNAFELKKAILVLFTPPYAESDTSYGRAVAFSPTATWGKGTLCALSDPLKSSSNATGRYNVLFVETILGHQVCTGQWLSQNTTNVFGTMQEKLDAGKTGLQFYTDTTKLMQITNPTDSMTCVKIVGYAAPIVAKNSQITLYGVRT